LYKKVVQNFYHRKSCTNYGKFCTVYMLWKNLYSCTKHLKNYQLTKILPKFWVGVTILYKQFFIYGVGGERIANLEKFAANTKE
jgi:hypothetical protein